ncbi:uncharacterized protein BJX67DRAFT_343923 [Aspergillus lucknowensis]|uniref:Uncharacterized protein n=1 Tax=Aspergillus lucknowensis TaxID=176173 RepID=A0ABR4M3R4_9EURO
MKPVNAVNMTWEEVSPGHFQRPLGENERFIKAIGDRAHNAGREHWSVTAYATFDFKLNFPDSSADVIVERLGQAWKALRFEHPSIASIAGEDTVDYIVPKTSDLEHWVNQTFSIIDGGQTLDDVIAGLRPSQYVTGYYLPRTSQFLIHLAHWRTDGYGALQLLDSFFGSSLNSDAENLPWGSEVSRLVPTVEEALDNPIDSTPEIHEAAQKYLSTVALTKDAVGVAQTKDVSTPPAGTRSAHLRFSPEATEAITKACEEKDISVLSAVHASTAAATWQFASLDSKIKPYTSTMRFTLRPYLPEPYNNATVAAGIYTGGYMFQVPASQSWLETASQYHHEYETGITADFLRSRRQYARDVLEKMKTPPPLPATPPSEVDISFVDAPSLIKPTYSTTDRGVVEVLEVGLGVETLTRQMYCFVWEFRGSLELSVVYNEAFYDQAFVEKVVIAIGDTLKRELGLST